MSVAKHVPVRDADGNQVELLYSDSNGVSSPLRLPGYYTGRAFQVTADPDETVIDYGTGNSVEPWMENIVGANVFYVSGPSEIGHAWVLRETYAIPRGAAMDIWHPAKLPDTQPWLPFLVGGDEPGEHIFLVTFYSSAPIEIVSQA